MKFRAVGATNVGTTKQTNQDSYLIKIAETELGDVALIAVCDGMGGLSKGELASAAVVRALSKWFEEKLPVLLETLSASVEGLEASVKGQWSGLVQDLNVEIMRYGAKSQISLGTTLTAMLFVGARYSVLHVGDSRAYEITESQATQLTTDQTFVAQEIEAGRMTEVEAKEHPQRNVLLQCVGSSPEVVPEIKHGMLDKDSTYLLCSDGFRHFLTSVDMHDRFEKSKLDALWDEKETCEVKKAIDSAIESVMQSGEKDNITAVVLSAFEG